MRQVPPQEHNPSFPGRRYLLCCWAGLGCLFCLISRTFCLECFFRCSQAPPAKVGRAHLPSCQCCSELSAPSAVTSVACRIIQGLGPSTKIQQSGSICILIGRLVWDVPVAHPYFLKSFGLFSELLLCSEYWEGRVNQASFCLHSSREAAHICFWQKMTLSTFLRR